MPLGSSSAAPVTSPGPNTCSSLVRPEWSATSSFAASVTRLSYRDCNRYEHRTGLYLFAVETTFSSRFDNCVAARAVANSCHLGIIPTQLALGHADRHILCWSDWRGAISAHLMIARRKSRGTQYPKKVLISRIAFRSGPYGAHKEDQNCARRDAHADPRCANLTRLPVSRSFRQWLRPGSKPSALSGWDRSPPDDLCCCAVDCAGTVSPHRRRPRGR